MEDNSLINEGFLRDLNEATIIFSPLPGSSKENVIIEEFNILETTQEVVIQSTHEKNEILTSVTPLKNTPKKLPETPV